MKLRVKYKVTEAGRFLGHLDLTRTIMKSLRRADIPIMLSAGFNPHPRLSFAMPLSVGHTGGGEFFEVDLKERMEEKDFINIFNEFAPPGIQALKAKEVIGKQESMSSIINSGKYLMDFTSIDIDLLKNIITEILAKKEIVILKKSKRKVKETDIRSFIYDIVFVKEENEGCTVEASIAQGSTANLRVQDLLKLFSLAGIAVEDVATERKGLYVKKDDSYFDLIEILKNVG